MPILHDGGGPGDGPVRRAPLRRDGPCEWCGAEQPGRTLAVVWERFRDEDAEPGDDPGLAGCLAAVLMCQSCTEAYCALGRDGLTDVRHREGPGCDG